MKLSLALLFSLTLCAQSLKEFEKKVTEFTLPNGLRFLIIERHDAPVVSFHTYVNVGSVDDPSGETGIAHMFEHMAFKGTNEIGTTNYAAEKLALAKVESAFAAYQRENLKEGGRDPAKVEQVEKAWKDAVEKANEFVKPNEFGEIVESHGGAGMNANTDLDDTTYFYSFPENRLELWAYLESERFLHPVMREFY